MKVRIDIDTRTFVRFWLVMFGLAVAAFAIYGARSALFIIGGSLFLAIALGGPVNAIARHLPGKSRVLATAAAFLSIVIILSGILFLAVPPIIQQTSKLIDSVPSLIHTVADKSKGVGTLIHKYNIQPQVDQAVKSFQESGTKWAAAFGKNVLSGASSLISMVVTTFLVLVLTFLMLIEGPMWKRRIWSVYRDKRRLVMHQRLANKMQAVVANYVTGQMTVSAIGAAASGLAVFVISLFIAAVPANLALPTVAVAFVLSLIPMFGATIGGILIALLLLINSWPAAVIYIIFFIVYQQIENNFIAPFIQAKRIALSPLIVLVALTIGLYVFGLIGGIISIPIAGCIKVLIEEYIAHRDSEEYVKEKPLAKLLKKVSTPDED